MRALVATLTAPLLLAFGHRVSRHVVTELTAEPESEAELPCKGHLCAPGTAGEYKKVCDDDEGTSCTVADCRARCETHANFTCAFYAHSKDEGDCYVMEACGEVMPHPEYDVYSLQEGVVAALCDKATDVKVAESSCPACTNGTAAGGCPERLCQTGFTGQWSKICDDNRCSFEQCEQLCQEHNAFKCNFFGYESEEGDCFLFEQCGKLEENVLYVLYARDGDEARAACEK